METQALPLDEIHKTSLEKDLRFQQKIIPDAFYQQVDEYGQKYFLIGKGYETELEGASINLADFTPSNPNERGFDKEIYVQEKGYGDEPGTIYHLKYSRTKNAWIAEHKNFSPFILDSVEPITVGESESCNFTYHYEGSDLIFSNSLFSPERIVVLDTKDILPTGEMQEGGDDSSDIIQQYRKQVAEAKRDKTPTLEELQIWIEQEDENEVRDISQYAEEWATEETLPKMMKVRAELVQGIKHLWAHSMYDTEYLAETYQEKHNWSARWNHSRQKKKYYLMETGHAIVKDEQSGGARLSKTKFAVGKSERSGQYIDLGKAQARAEAAGEQVIGTFHVHPSFPEGYLETQSKKFKPLPDEDKIKLRLSEAGKLIAKELEITMFEDITPPSIGDIATSAYEKGVHIVASKDKLYVTIGKLGSKGVGEDEMYRIYHAKVTNFLGNYIKTAGEKGRTHIPKEELEKVILYPFQEFCQEIGVAMYMADWDSKTKGQSTTILRRIA